MKSVLILCGGRSAEHEISLISAKAIIDALDRKQFSPIIIGISKKGVWHLEEETSFYEGEFRADKIRLNEKRPTVLLQPFTDSKGRGVLLCEGKTLPFDVAFPMLHGQYGEDGTIQGVFSTIGVPYVGASPGASALCMDKVLLKALCRTAGIPVADFVWLSSPSELKAKKAEIERLGFPLFAKPPTQGSSVGVSKVTKMADLAAAVDTCFKYDSRCLLERAIVGREIECAVLGLHGKAKVALPGEIIPSPKIGWYSYEAKYLLADGAETVGPASLDPVLTKKVQDMALHVFNVTECDGMARVDLFIEKGSHTIYLNEPNTIPGFTPISMYPKMWQASGMSYAELVTALLNLAFEKAAR